MFAFAFAGIVSFGLNLISAASPARGENGEGCADGVMSAV